MRRSAADWDMDDSDEVDEPGQTGAPDEADETGRTGDSGGADEVEGLTYAETCVDIEASEAATATIPFCRLVIRPRW